MPSVTIKNEEFRYPTRDELRKIRPETPRLKTFGFPYVREIEELLQNIAGMEDVARRSHLHWWDHCLVNRAGRLSHSYRTALVHYNRGLPDEIKDYRHEHYVNRAQFGYYGETYFYFFISVRDTIAHLVNIYWRMGIPEDKLYVNKEFCSKIPDQQVKDLFNNFLNDTKLTSDYRNGLAHRFLLTHEDHRPTISYENGGMMFEAGRGDNISSSQLIAEIRRSMLCLAGFLENLRTVIKP